MSKPTPSQQAAQALYRFAERSPWRKRMEDKLLDLVRPVANTVDMAPEEVLGLLADYDLHHTLESAAIEMLLAERFDEAPHNLLEDFLRRRGWKLGAEARDYLRAIPDSPVGYYEVLESVPGRHVVIRDMLLPETEPIRVHERTGSRYLFRWDRIGARVLDLRGRRIFSGTLLPFPAADDNHETLDEMIEAMREEMRALAQRRIAELGDAIYDDLPDGFRELDGETLIDILVSAGLNAAMATALTTAWITFTIDQLTAPPPELVNRDGEPLHFGTARFVASGRSEAWIRALDAADDMERFQDAPPGWHWLAKEETPLSPEETVHFDSQSVEGRTLLATLVLSEDVLEAKVNSEGRMARLQARLAELLPGLPEPASLEWEPLEAALEKGLAMLEDGQIPENALPEEVRSEVERDFKDNYYRKLLDEPVPMLGGRTPRECASGDPEARAELVRWLKHLENSELRGAARTGEAPYELSWMWEALGLAEEPA